MERSCISLTRTSLKYGIRSKAPDKKPSGIKPPRIIDEIIAKYAVDANLHRLRSTHS